MKCIVVDDNQLSLTATQKLISKVAYLDHVASFVNPVEALSFLSENKIDLIFLDIEMPEINGINFMESLSQPHPLIIMTTVSKSHALEAYDHDVTDYLVKPIEVSRFMKAVVKAKDALEKDSISFSDENAVFVKKEKMIVKVNKSDILWIEGLGDYVVLNTEKEKYVVHSTMQSIEEKFSNKNFLRVHRSFIIQMDKILNIEDNTIAFFNKLIPIGKTYLKEVYSRLNLL